VASLIGPLDWWKGNRGGPLFWAQFFLAFSPDKRVDLASLEVFRASLVTVHGQFFILVT